MFKDDVITGPGCYTFPRPESNNNKGGRHRVRFDGVFDGRPCGKGVVVWSDGERSSGEYDGMEMIRKVPEKDVEGVLEMAYKNGEMAKRVVAEIEQELMGRGEVVAWRR